MKATKTRLPMDVLDPFAPTARLVAAPVVAPPSIAVIDSVPAPALAEGMGESPLGSPVVAPAGVVGLRRMRRETAASALGPRGYVAGGRRPAPDLGDEPPVRLTAYLRPDQVQCLRREVVKRQTAGQRADLSALLREAVDDLLPPTLE